MARHGITYEDVITAANTLKSEGKSITIENIRRFLGTGSAGTVNQHLRRWKEAQQSTQKIASKENLPEGLIALVKGLWEGVLAQTKEQFTPIESHYQQEISELKAEIEKYRNNNQRWQKLFTQWQQEKTVLANEKSTLEQALEFAHKENQSLHNKYDALLLQLQEKKDRIEELHRLHTQVQENLEYYRESTREQRLLEQQQFEQQKQALQTENKTLTEKFALQREKISTIQHQYQLLQQSYSLIENKNQEISDHSKKIAAQLENSEKSNAELLHSTQRLQTVNQSLKEELSSIQIEVRRLSQKAEETNQALLDLQDKNKLLTQEKWVLAQEKAQVEGQLKQMQKMIVA